MTKSSNTSPRKAAANRRNASKSTGPRTAGGKSWSRLNALKHGILASQAVIATIEGRADRKLFEATVEGLAQDFEPVGTYEQLLVQEIAACFWRKRRLLMFENHAAFDVIECSASHLINYPLEKPIPWRDPLYTEGGKLTTAEQIYKDAGIDGITLPNEADTLRVIRYEAAINRTRERAVRSLREMRAARRGAARPRAEIAPAVDRPAARRNASRAQAKMLSPYFGVRVWDRLAKVYREAEEEQEEALRGELRGGEAETDQTKPKKVITPDIIEDMRKSLYRGLYGREMPEESEDEPATPPDDPNKPPAT
jgi:hypothetical protein